jgi:tetratricopeptide (TPR) repeat protein
LNTLKTIYKPLAAFFITSALLQGCGNDGSSTKDQTKIQEYADRADNYRHQGQYRAAIIEARNALQKDPKNRAAIAHLGAIFNELGQGRTSTKIMEPLAADATRDEALIIARAHLIQHKYQSALDSLDTAAKRSVGKDSDGALLLRAQAQMGLGKIDEAQNTLASIANPSTLSQLEGARAFRRATLKRVNRASPNY